MNRFSKPGRYASGRTFFAVVALLAVLAAACGVERESDDTLAADATDSEESGTESATGDDDTGDDAGNDGEDGGESAEDTQPPTTLASPTTPTTGPPDEIALSADFGDENWEITHGELNAILVPTQENEEFVLLVFGGAPPPAFDVGVLTQRLTSEAIQFELAEIGASITDETREAARTGLLASVETLYVGSPDPSAEAERLVGEVPYLEFLVEYQAAQDALSEILAEDADPAAGVPCVRHILVDTEPEGDDIITRLEAGEDFGQLAIELSTGPSGPTGGDLGCAPTANYVPPFAEAVDTAEVGAYVGPVETQFGWHVITVDSYEVDGRTLVADRLRERLQAATVEVDDLLGSWDSEQGVVLPLGQ